MTKPDNKPETVAKETQLRLSGRAVFFFSLLVGLFQIFISFPIAVWARNKFNFEAPLSYSYSVLGISFAAIFALSALLTLIAPRRLRAILTPIFVVLCAAIFIQQNFLNWNYGILDGKTLDFTQNAGLGFVDVALWLGALAALIFGQSLIARQASNIVVGVGAISLIMAGTHVATYGEVDTPYTIDERAKFEFSNQQNIIVFLLDAFQMDVLLEIADSEPEVLAPLTGFTAYPDTAAVFAKTYPTIPLFLTGKRYQKKEPLLDFFDLAYDGSMLEVMQRQGWDIGLYPNVTAFPSLINAIDLDPRIMDNVIGGVPTQAKIDTYLQSLDLSLFRAVPHGLKPAVFNHGKFAVRRDGVKTAFTAALGDTDIPQPFTYKSTEGHTGLAFRSLLNEHGKVSNTQPVFRFYHMMFPHAPFRLDKDLNVVPHKDSFEIYRDYSLASLKLMGDYAARLKEIGAYDNATIMVVSDHGMGFGNALQYDPQAKDYVKAGQYGYRRAAAKAILLVKKPNETGPLTWSDKPTSGLDVAPTLAAAAGLSLNDFEGQDIETIAEDDVRSRPFNFYTFSTWDSKYLDDFEAYSVDGDVRETASWTRLGMVKEAVTITNKDRYSLGALMSFGQDIKTDTDYLNAFIDVEDFKVTPNFIEAESGEMSITIPLARAARASDALLLQFEIYSGETAERVISVNGVSAATTIKPKMRQLNRGYFITPDMHGGRKRMDLSFAAPAGKTVPPLRLASIKLSALEPKLLAVDEDITADFNAYVPVGFDVTRKAIGLPHHRSGAFIFDAADDICRNNSLRLGLESAPASAPKLSLNGTALQLFPTQDSEGRQFEYACSDVTITRHNVLEMTIETSVTEPAEGNMPASTGIDTLLFIAAPE